MACDELVLNGIPTIRENEKEKLLCILSDPACENLVTLALINNGLDEEYFDRLLPVLRHRNNLTYLDLSGNQVGNAFVNAMSKSPILKIQTLMLQGTGMDSKAIAKLGTLLKDFDALRTLDIRHNEDSDDDAISVIIDNIRYCPSLKRLRISLFKVTKNGFAYLKKNASTLSGLKELNLLHTPSPELIIQCAADLLPR